MVLILILGVRWLPGGCSLTCADVGFSLLLGGNTPDESIRGPLLCLRRKRSCGLGLIPEGWLGVRKCTFYMRNYNIEHTF